MTGDGVLDARYQAGGAELKRHRKARRLSLQQLSERSGVSRSMISKIERSETVPSVALFGKLARALGVALPDAAPAPDRTIIHVPRNLQTAFNEGISGFSRRALSPVIPGRSIDWVSMTLPPGGRTSDIDIHRRGLEQYVYLLEGSLTAHIDGRLLALETGDSLYFQADTRHSFENTGGRNLPVFCHCRQLTSRLPLTAPPAPSCTDECRIVACPRLVAPEIRQRTAVKSPTISRMRCGALGGTRTPTLLRTATSRQRVYQFRHER